MDIRYKGTDYELTPDIERTTTQKIESLRKFMRGKDSAASAYVELGKAVGGQQTGAIWRAEINLDLAGTRFRSESLRETLETALDEAVAEMGRELRRAKRETLHAKRKGGAALKSMLRGFWPGT